MGILYGLAAISILTTLVVPTRLTYNYESPSIKRSSTEVASSTVKTLDTELARLAAKYGQDPELVRKIIECESRGDPYALRKNYENGYHWSSDHSYWQINDYYWYQEFFEKGIDIKVPEQNLEAGFLLLQEHGTKLWKWSAPCWNEIPD